MHYGRGKQRPLRLETGTHNKAIQKALESYRVSDEKLFANVKDYTKQEQQHMTYHQKIILKNGKTAVLRNGTLADAEAALENFNLTHGETDDLLSYPDENSLTAAQEGAFLAEKTASKNEIEIIALVDGQIVGMAGIEALGTNYKVCHRAEFGIAIAKAYWGLGLGKAMTEACIACARQAGYRQLELNVVAGNEHASALYRKCGFVEYGRNPRGFNSRISGYQELVYMRLEL